jgi:hypothetical protein
VLGLQGSTINLSSGPLRITGNVGIGQNGIFNFSGGGQVNGGLDADNTAQVNISGGGTTVTGGIVRMSMASIQNAALAESNAAASLTPTQTFNQITSAQTIVGNERSSTAYAWAAAAVVIFPIKTTRQAPTRNSALKKHAGQRRALRRPLR